MHFMKDLVLFDPCHPVILFIWGGSPQAPHIFYVVIYSGFQVLVALRHVGDKGFDRFKFEPFFANKVQVRLHWQFDTMNRTCHTIQKKDQFTHTNLQ